MAETYEPTIQPTFETMLQSQRDTLAQRRQEIHEQRQTLDKELDGIERQLLALKAYEDALRGRLPTTERKPRQRREGGKRGERREKLMAFIRENFEAGATRAELLQAMDIDEKDADGKKQAQSVSNALSALVKDAQLKKDGRTYMLP